MELSRTFLAIILLINKPKLSLRIPKDSSWRALSSTVYRFVFALQICICIRIARDISKVSFDRFPAFVELSRTFLAIILLINEPKLSLRIPKDSSWRALSSTVYEICICIRIARDISKVSFDRFPAFVELSRTFLAIILLINEPKLSLRIPKDSSWRALSSTVYEICICIRIARDISKVSFDRFPAFVELSRTFLAIILLINEPKLSLRIPKDSSWRALSSTVYRFVICIRIARDISKVSFDRFPTFVELSRTFLAIILLINKPKLSLRIPKDSSWRALSSTVYRFVFAFELPEISQR